MSADIPKTSHAFELHARVQGTGLARIHGQSTYLRFQRPDFTIRSTTNWARVRIGRAWAKYEVKLSLDSQLQLHSTSSQPSQYSRVTIHKPSTALPDTTSSRAVRRRAGQQTHGKSSSNRKMSDSLTWHQSKDQRGSGNIISESCTVPEGKIPGSIGLGVEHPAPINTKLPTCRPAGDSAVSAYNSALKGLPALVEKQGFQLRRAETDTEKLKQGGRELTVPEAPHAPLHVELCWLKMAVDHDCTCTSSQVQLHDNVTQRDSSHKWLIWPTPSLLCKLHHPTIGCQIKHLTNFRCPTCKVTKYAGSQSVRNSDPKGGPRQKQQARLKQDSKFMTKSDTGECRGESRLEGAGFRDGVRSQGGPRQKQQARL
ncbi:hypothetical protein DFH06DRAFT_1151971 [Mycena polygramma]|nr:hypothetical protein DFH06DRAFT_1151971 [Mycena polygramma]